MFTFSFTFSPQVRHDYVVALKEVLASRTKIFIVLELITGGELFDKIVAEGRFEEARARFYIRQVCMCARHACSCCASRAKMRCSARCDAHVHTTCYCPCDCASVLLFTVLHGSARLFVGSM